MVGAYDFTRLAAAPMSRFSNFALSSFCFLHVRSLPCVELVQLTQRWNTRVP